MSSELADEHYWTFSEWKRATVNKIVGVALKCDPKHQQDYLSVQIGLAIEQALRHGRYGRSNDDPVTPITP